MNLYHHFTAFERNCIEIRISDGKTLTEIGKELGRSKSSIWREVHRLPAGEYSAEAANGQYEKLRSHCHQEHILDAKPELREMIAKRILDDQWSPEQIVGRWEHETSEKPISYQTIYREIYRNNLGVPKKAGERGLPRKLRHRGKTRHDKNFHEKRGKIQIDHPIEERPVEAQDRLRIGDWEADTVVGKAGGEVLVTLVDRKSRFLLCAKSASKKAASVTTAINALLEPLKAENRLTITPDRGKEFSNYREIEELFGLVVYFPDAHSPWERGTNENTNGLVREYIPKSTDLSNFTSDEIKKMVSKINNRPRKCLGFKTPFEFFFNKSFHLA